MAIAGNDFCVVASDTRLSEGFSIHSRDLPKTVCLSNNTVLASCGFHGDVLTLTSVLEARQKVTSGIVFTELHLSVLNFVAWIELLCAHVQMYEHEHQKKQSTSAMAAMLSTMLYNRRFFPYYVYNIVGGLDEQGRGAVYSYDPVGSYEREEYRAGGSAGAILQPLLDNQVRGLFISKLLLTQ